MIFLISRIDLYDKGLTRPIFYFRLLATAGATNLLLVTLLIPVSALLLGIAFLGEEIAPLEFLGMGCIALGLVVLDGRLFSLRSRAI